MARMSQLLEEALPLDEPARRAWLARLPPEHQDLAAARRQALLPEESQAEPLQGLLSLPKLSTADEASAPAASGLKSGARVGPYELIRLLGAGGMAEVWLARRADGAFKREVALKLPMLAHARAGLEARFARERDILASLEHPHIARLYDAGVDPEGLPYLAMEYVQGEPLTGWCDAHRLGIPERLRLFLQVLEAVQYAHEKKVIHRDLKPSNILVTESGQVRLLDFGVARLLEAEETDQPALTSVYGRALTPDYASPELLRGDAIDARSDLYSLGVLLYELLSGTRPYRLKRAASIGALDQAIATLEVKKPSLQLEQAGATTCNSTVEQLARQLRGDLDAIVLMALAKEPARRYPSAAAMAEDLRRYLEARPIRAQPARIFYRLRKFVRRNGTLLGVSAVALAAILATVGYARYRENRAQVTVSAKALAAPAAPSPASTVDAFAPPAHSIAVLPFVNMSGDASQEYFSDGLSEELIDKLTNIADLRVPARTSSFYFKGKQATIADIAKALGVAHVLEGSVRKSGNTIRVTAQLIRVDNGYHIWSETYDRKLEDIFKVQDEIAGAVVTALRVNLLPMQQPSAQEELHTANLSAYSLYLQGRESYNQGNTAGHQRAVTAFRAATALDPRYAAAYADLAVAQFWLTDDNMSGDLATDLAGFESALAAAEKAVALAPGLAAGYSARGFLRLATRFDFAGAQADLDKALALSPGDANIMHRSAILLAVFGKLPAAIAREEQALALDPLSAEICMRLAYFLVANQQLAQARPLYEKALVIAPNSDRALFNLGELELLENQPDRALVLFRRTALEPFRLEGEAKAEYSLGHVDVSQRLLEQFIAKYGKDSPNFVARIYAWRGEKDQAFEWLERAYEVRDDGLPFLKFDPGVRSLRGDPRYKALLRKMNLPE
jgi:serine/threonine protein kinase/TolB-like protein/Flp pilus assembly protein TadD